MSTERISEQAAVQETTAGPARPGDTEPVPDPRAGFRLPADPAPGDEAVAPPSAAARRGCRRRPPREAAREQRAARRQPDRRHGGAGARAADEDQFLRARVHGVGRFQFVRLDQIGPQ
ncbi:hypothetical protein PV342_32700, partial [Streptomyces sp. PA03-3a]|nr:hypothetical protein [Streptomyces sp. PA03-3a]